MNDFVSADEKGTPALILDDSQFAPSHSLKRFMEPLADVTIPARQAKAVTVTITVPNEARPGGYFGAIRFAPSTPDNGGQVNLSASVASLVLMTVPGKTTQKLDLTDFSIQQNGKSGSYFIDAQNIEAFIRLFSSSDVQIGPFGKISLLKSEKVIYETDFNNKNPRDMILPESARRWEVPLDKINGFGHYTVKAVFTYGQTNQTIEATRSFWVIPKEILIVGIAGGLLVTGVGIGVWVFVRNRRHPYRRSRIHFNRQ